MSVARWLANRTLPADEWRSVDALVRQLDFHGDELAEVERDIAIEAIDDPVVARLMTVPGIDVTVAIAIVAAVGDFSRFDDPDRLVSYLGLNPRVRQSGNGPAVHGRITKAGPAQARGMLVEAAFSASRAPGPLRAFYRRVKERRGFQVATVAIARKMTVLCWHLVTRGEDYAFARPSLNAHKRRKLELAAGANSSADPSAVPRTTTTSSSYATRNERSSSRPNAPTKYSSPTGNRNDPPRTLDNLIRRVDDAANLVGEGEEGDHALPGAFPHLERRGTSFAVGSRQRSSSSSTARAWSASAAV